ncbi:MAG: 3-phosphoshikimate 1-carboxyvinyltransferase, partial [Clostridia bacterium]|nr:3-phosphoshikimate 1-carboxyvinyltransferase [Clostridia bacterium]
MNVAITPSVAKGSVTPPPSKSYAHRLLVCAALSRGESIIENIGTNDDILATADCLRNMGADIKLDGTTATVKGIGLNKMADRISLFCNESGSTLRFLIPLSLVFSKKATFSGKGRLMERPQTVYEELFTAKGCSVEKSDGKMTVSGQLHSGLYEVAGDVSSQFITGLLFALPLLSGDSEIHLTTPLQSAPYIDITIDVLSRFGVEVKATDYGYFIKGLQTYTAHNEVCEGDWSNAAFLDGFNLAGGSVELENMSLESKQGDMIYRDYFRQLNDGAPVLDITQCPDLGPVLIACAVLKNGARLIGTNRLKIKESDRGQAMAQELLKLGVDLENGDDYIIIPKCEIKASTENIYCHNDHRIAMSFALLCSVVGGTLEGAECVNKSYPE